jgi:nucleolar protein 58
MYKHIFNKIVLLISLSCVQAIKKVISKDVQDQLLVADAKLGNAIKDKLNLSCISNSSVHELIRCIRSQTESLISGLPKKEMTAMALGLSHRLVSKHIPFNVLQK